MPVKVAALVFDAYGTLFDVGSAVAGCDALSTSEADGLGALWRAKQLEYSWLRSLQDRYAPFSQITAEALDYALEAIGRGDAIELREYLLANYRRLSPFPEIRATLEKLQGKGVRMAILSNGSPDMLDAVVEASALSGYFAAVISVAEVGCFKPAPRVYQLALDRLGLGADEIGFVSANGWDAHAAAAFGMRVFWCNRTGRPRERLPGKLAATIRSLAELPDLVR
jgi:2-haloacid dehalogenase